MQVVEPRMPRSVDGTPQTADRPLRLGQTSFKRTDDGSESMNINGVPAGAATVLWNGTGASDTGGDWTASGEGSETSESMHSGTNGWDTGLLANDDEVIFSTGLHLHPEDFSQLSFWWQPKVMPGNAQPRIRWTDGGDSNKGDELDLEDYVTNFDVDVWQKITIPLTDFNFNAEDEIQKLKIKFHNSGQHVWLDDFELQEEGGDGPFIFQVAAPSADERYHVSMIVLVVSGIATGWSADTFANVTALSSGLLLRQRRLSTAEVLWSLNSRDNVDLFGRFHPQDDVVFADNNLLVGFMVKPGKASVIVTDDDVIEVMVRDNLSGLDVARAYLHYGVETALEVG